MRYCWISILIFFLSATNSFAQSLTAKEIEDDLVHEYSKLESFSEQHNFDSIAYEDSVFRNKFADYIQKYPFTLTYPFKKLNDELYVVTSDDSLLRIYSWDTWSGGTMHYFNNIFQFKSGKNIYFKLLFDTSDEEEGDPLFYSNIYTLNANEKVYYLCVNNGIYSTSDASQSIKVFCIENNRLNDTVHLIKTNTGVQNEIIVEYNFFSVIDRPERPIELIKYDTTKKIIYIPLVLDDGKVTDKFIRYQFNGKYFQRISN
jgi:hypothetical protein